VWVASIFWTHASITALRMKQYDATDSLFAPQRKCRLSPGPISIPLKSPGNSHPSNVSETVETIYIYFLWPTLNISEHQTSLFPSSREHCRLVQRV
jgi:hypothetical protein